MEKARTDHPIHDLLASRWSPYGFANKEVSLDDVRSLFEAARWAPSSYNEQPWRWLVAVKSDADGFARLLSCLVESNQTWARHASVLAIAATVRLFTRNGKENRACEHDLGLAAANLTVEATARGLAVHQMIGIDRDRCRAVLGIPEEATPLTGIAIGYAEPASPSLDESLRQRDEERRGRKPLAELVFGATWGQTSDIVAG